jgi:dihydroneopterin aldolase / 2-amino-4-hydroxy-6-hydroxymethyldihydropteridine diphosphokinase
MSRRDDTVAGLLAKLESPELDLPHPTFDERRFVLISLSEIAPDRCPDGWVGRLAPAGVHPRGLLGQS